MAIGDAYATLAEFKEHARISDTTDDVQIPRVLNGVSRSVEKYCRRQFNDAGSASARVFEPDNECVVWVDDFHTTSGLVVQIDTTDDGTFDTTVSTSDYLLRPLNGIWNGLAGFPSHQIELVGSGVWFRPHNRRPSVQVTAQWGWSSVPDAVKTATLLKAAKVFGRRSSPHGQPVVGSGDMLFRISRQEDPDVVDELDAYRHVLARIAVA